MSRSDKSDTCQWSPGEPLPVYADRTTLARIITHLFFPVAPRTLRVWPLVAFRPNKRIVYRVEDALKLAEERLSNAPAYKQGASLGQMTAGRGAN